jgi:hypothetical protein
MLIFCSVSLEKIFDMGLSSFLERVDNFDFAVALCRSVFDAVDCVPE